ncbi:MAG: type II secretion system protein [Phycisphaerales bacterium]|jgi:prepilin-type N-terminal cleavage/methylation domain-containing protein|nr:type II secretion system protein [Phycisphaerales bacterium]
MTRTRRAFTLAELLMVLGIMAITTSMILPLAGDNDVSRLRAAAELLAADIEDVQGRSLANPGAPTCLRVTEGGVGWHLAFAEEPEEPILDIEGRPLVRRFGAEALAGCAGVSLQVEDLPEDGLQFDDQGAPVALPATIDFLLMAGDEPPSTFRVRVSASTGRVTIERN